MDMTDNANFLCPFSSLRWQKIGGYQLVAILFFSVVVMVMVMVTIMDMAMTWPMTDGYAAIYGRMSILGYC